MAYTTINKSTDYFNTKLYTGNGSTQAITGVGHQPDFIWVKDRDSTRHHYLADAVRGVKSRLRSDATDEEYTAGSTDGFDSFDSDGFTLEADSSSLGLNENGSSQVSWNWKANGAGSANSDGATATTVSANTTAGFSIVKYNGTGTNTNFGHGLGVAPNVIIIKSTSGSHDWVVNGDFLDSTTWQHKVILNTTAAKATADNFDDTKPTNSVFYLNGSHTTVNGSGEAYVAYCFAEKTGYSKFGSYTGNGNADGTFIYTGFKPNFVMTKKVSGTADWMIRDNKRDFNGQWRDLYANNTNAETSPDSNTQSELLSNGFKLRMSHSNHNESGGTYIYMAFGQTMVGSNNVPCTAR